MAETDNNMQSAGVDSALKMRNTETAALKRMPVSANAASASSAARKTIKLKPLVSSTGSNPGTQTDAQSAKVAPPSILLNRKPAAPAADQTPKFMSTNTAPIVKMAKPDAEKPVQSNDLNPNAAPTKTVSIPRFQNRTPSAPAVPVSPSAPTIATTTGAMPKITRPAAPAAPTIATTTGAMPKITRPAAPGTVKPTYISTATTTVPKTPVPENAPAPTITQGIEKQEAISQAKMKSGLQEAKPAIKLRPSASPEQSPENLSPASPTIKLSPRTESTVSPLPPNAEGGDAAAAAAPAKKEDVTVTTKLPRPKLQLKANPNGATPAAAQPQQAKLREQGDIANKLKEQNNEEGDQTISQDEIEQNASSDIEAKLKNKKNEKFKNEPNIFFAICAILAFLVIGYTVFALTAQYLNTWEQKKIPVVGFEQIDQSMKK